MKFRIGKFALIAHKFDILMMLCLPSSCYYFFFLTEFGTGAVKYQSSVDESEKKLINRLINQSIKSDPKFFLQIQVAWEGICIDGTAKIAWYHSTERCQRPT